MYIQYGNTAHEHYHRNSTRPYDHICVQDGCYVIFLSVSLNNCLPFLDAPPVQRRRVTLTHTPDRAPSHPEPTAAQPLRRLLHGAEGSAGEAAGPPPSQREVGGEDHGAVQADGLEEVGALACRSWQDTQLTLHAGATCCEGTDLEVAESEAG